MDLTKELEELKTKITPMNTAKFIAGTMVSIGAYAVVIAMTKSGLAGSRGVTKLLMRFGIFTIACKVGEMAKDHFEKMFDDVLDDIKEMQKEEKENA